MSEVRGRLCDNESTCYPSSTGARCHWYATIYVGDKGYCRAHASLAQEAIDKMQKELDEYRLTGDGGYPLVVGGKQ